MPLNPQDIVRLRAELLRHVDSERSDDAIAPFDPTDLCRRLTSEIEAASRLADPVPQAPFPSHRYRTAWLVRGAKGLGAWLVRPFARFLFQRQADLNHRMLRTIEDLVELVRSLGEPLADRDDQIAAWRADQARARDERVLVLDALASLTAEIEALARDLGSGAAASDSRLRRVEDKLDGLARLVVTSDRR